MKKVKTSVPNKDYVNAAWEASGIWWDFKKKIWVEFVWKDLKCKGLKMKKRHERR